MKDAWFAVKISYDRGALTATDVEMALEQGLGEMGAGRRRSRGVRAVAAFVSESTHDRLVEAGEHDE